MEKGTTILFGLPGVAVQSVERVTGGDGVMRLVHVVATASSAAGCPAGCAARRLPRWPRGAACLRSRSIR